MPGTPSELRWGRPLNRKRADDRGEALALEHLLGKGYSLVERNYRTRYGEIDLILRAAETLVFVEVKLRRGSGYGDPLKSVTPRKQATIRSPAEVYLAERAPGFEAVRFDVVGILEMGGGREVHHIEDAF